MLFAQALKKSPGPDLTQSTVKSFLCLVESNVLYLPTIGERQEVVVLARYGSHKNNIQASYYLVNLIE